MSLTHLILADPTYVPFDSTSKDSIFSAGDTAWLLASASLVLLMTPALAFFYGGMVRSKHVLGMLMQNFAAIAIVSVTWVVIGFSWAFDRSKLQNPPSQFDDAVHRIGTLGCWIDAIKRGPGPRQIAMGRLTEENAGGIGKRSGDSAKQGAHLAEQLDLGGIERVIRYFGAGEMAHDERDAGILAFDAGSNGCCLGN